MHAKTVNLLSTLSHADSCKMITFSFYYYPRGNLKTKKKKKNWGGRAYKSVQPRETLDFGLCCILQIHLHVRSSHQKKICISISSWKSGLGGNRGLPFLQGSNNLELDNMKAKKTQQVGAETSKG